MVPIASQQTSTGLSLDAPPSACPDDARGDSDVERRLQAVLDVTSGLTGQDFFASLVRHLAAALEVRFAFVAQCTDETKTSVRTLAFWSGDDLRENFRYAVAGTPCERVMQNEVCFYSRDLASRFPSDHDLKTLGVQAYLGIPVLGLSGDVVGHLVVMDVDRMERPRPGDRILKLFAMRAGAEIERRQVERVQRRYAERLKTLQEIDRAILAAQSPTEIAAPALEHVQALVPCFRISVALFDPETGEGVLHAVRTEGEGLGQGARVAPESFGSLDELRAGNVRTVEDALSLPQSPAVDRLVQTGLRSWVNVPLVAQGELYGTLNVGWDEPGTPSADAINILQEVADSQAVAIRQARLFKEVSALQAEMSLARDIHATLVPPVDCTVQHMELFGQSLPSSAMGGDLLDLVEADGRMGVFVADVSGHGVKAGVVMGMLKGAVRTQLLAPTPMAVLLSKLNRVLLQLEKLEMYVTLACMRFTDASTAEFSLAGHLPILHYRSQERVIRQLRNQHFPLGMFDNADYGSQTVKFDPGDIFVLLTDGLTEVENESGEEFGHRQIEALVTKSATGPLPELYRRITTAARQFGKQVDDQTLLLVRAL